MREYGVFIGRFQPLHTAHIATIRLALEKVQKLIVVIGSCHKARDVKNPWTGPEREKMIRMCLSQQELGRVGFVHARDYLYNDNMWITAIQTAIDQIVDDDAADIVLFGHDKDRSSFYLKLFPRWDFYETGEIDMPVNATDIRDMYFQGDLLSMVSAPLLHDRVYSILRDSIERNDETYKALKAEYDYIRDYKKLWSGAPYPVTFVTSDSVVICSGHVLLVRRRAAPGRGLFALPGGFVNPAERLLDGAIRELKEETAIKLTEKELKPLMVDSRVFDHPDRSLRGRTITHAFCFNVNQKQNKLPQVKGMDDADKAFWMPLNEVFAREDEFFEDHIHIIRAFVNRF